MKYYKLKADVDKYAWLTSDRKDILDNWILGKLYGREWKIIKLHQLLEDGEKKAKLSDLIHLTTELKVISEKAKSVIECSSKNDLEFLPVEIEGTSDPYYILNVYDIVDCLDHKASKVTRYKSSGRIMHVDKFAFHKDKIGNKSCFRIKDNILTIVVDHALKDAIDGAVLTGFIFEDLSKENTMVNKFQAILNKSRRKEQ